MIRNYRFFLLLFIVVEYAMHSLHPRALLLDSHSQMVLLCCVQCKYKKKLLDNRAHVLAGIPVLKLFRANVISKSEAIFLWPQRAVMWFLFFYILHLFSNSKCYDQYRVNVSEVNVGVACARELFSHRQQTRKSNNISNSI